MIPQTECRAIFYYGYRPQTDEYRMDPMDGGFNLTMYEDGRLLFELVDPHGSSRQRLIYDTPSMLKEKYRAFLDANSNAIAAMDTALALPDERSPRFISSIGLEGYSFITAEDLPQLCHLPFGSPEGRCGRRLCSLMEDLAEVLLPFGIRFSLFGFETDDQVLQPVNQTPGNDPVWSNNAAS